MKRLWLHHNNCKDLIVFCNGWGMDEQPFLPLSAQEYDVCMFYDYTDSDLHIDGEMSFGSYDQLILIGWSMGVWAGQHLFAGNSEKFSRKIAINGTLCPINDNYGITVKIFDDTLLNFGKAARLKFYRRMCRDKKNLDSFLANQPERTLASQHLELNALRENTDCMSAEESIYNEIIIAENDWIMPTANQNRFWQKHNVVHIPGFHFPFFRWQSWDQLLMFSE